TNVNGTVFFQANPGLWKSDGTATGTVQIKSSGGKAFTQPFYLTNVNGTLLFEANDGTAYGLWKSDGTDAGTVLIKEFSKSRTRAYFTEVNGTLFFAANDGVNGAELWKTDG